MKYATKQNFSKLESFLLDLIMVDTSGVQQGFFIHIQLNNDVLFSIPQ
jgi:hypothetical protein